MIVAAGALEGQPHERGADGVDAVGNAFLAVFLRDRAALVGLAVDAVEGGGELLVAGGVREEIAGELLDDELVEGQVFVEGTDHPIAVGPGLGLDVRLIAEGIRVACEIEPRRGHVFAEARGSEQAVHHGFMGLR